MAAYYNEFDPRAAAWLRELIRAGLIPPGDVDERSITEVSPHELVGYTQQHFFAGIGGWAYALRLAGWPDNRPVRTGSCPCQPFSDAGEKLGFEDPRHLWPHFRDLITFGEATITFGEQVASALGRQWLARVRSDLEGLGYAVGGADLCAAGIGAPHIRQRLWWVAYSGSFGREERAQRQVGNTGGRRLTVRRGATGGLANHDAAGCRQAGRMGDPGCDGCGSRGRTESAVSHQPGYWSVFDVIPCADGKARRIEPGSFPLVARIPGGLGRICDPSVPFDPQACAEGRVMRLRGYGNAIVPELAAEFIQACCEAIGDLT